ncbi:hypothetical protein M3Y94_00114400 [Aphelenchoides besseyi]|nr:hypothetical protein M3Y94_00114400 [Aphelenchoides besseyi]KAI6237471.1 hypothetical protein M3Y95_00268600 [Aphelenchoides besseyi]
MKLLSRLGPLVFCVLLFGSFSAKGDDPPSVMFGLDAACRVYILENPEVDKIAEKWENTTSEGPCKNAKTAVHGLHYFVGYVEDEQTIAMSAFEIALLPENDTYVDLSKHFRKVNYSSVLGPCVFNNKSFSMFVDFYVLHMIVECNEQLGAFVRSYIYPSGKVHAPNAPLVYFKKSAEYTQFVGVSSNDYLLEDKDSNTFDSFFMRLMDPADDSGWKQKGFMTPLHQLNSTAIQSFVFELPVAIAENTTTSIAHYQVNTGNQFYFSYNYASEEETFFKLYQWANYPGAQINFGNFDAPFDTPLSLPNFTFIGVLKSWRADKYINKKNDNFSFEFSAGEVITAWKNEWLIQQPKCDMVEEQRNLAKCVDNGETNKFVLYTLYALTGVEIFIVLVTVLIFAVCIWRRRSQFKKRKGGKGSKKPKGKGAKSKDGAKTKDAKSKEKKSKDTKGKDKKDKKEKEKEKKDKKEKEKKDKKSKDAKSKDKKGAKTPTAPNTKPATADKNANANPKK